MNFLPANILTLYMELTQSHIQIHVKKTFFEDLHCSLSQINHHSAIIFRKTIALLYITYRPGIERKVYFCNIIEDIKQIANKKGGVHQRRMRTHIE